MLHLCQKTEQDCELENRHSLETVNMMNMLLGVLPS